MTTKTLADRRPVQWVYISFNRYPWLGSFALGKAAFAITIRMLALFVFTEFSFLFPFSVIVEFHLIIRIEL